MMRTSAGVVRSLALGDVRCDDLTVMIAEFLKPLSQALGASLDGIVGYNFLRQYRVTIDYPASRLVLAPPAPS